MWCGRRSSDALTGLYNRHAGEKRLTEESARADRDRINKKVMADPRLKDMMDPKAMPFDGKRMIYGGFKLLVQG